MRIFDSHCHLDPQVFDGDDGVDAAVRRAHDDGVLRMLTVGSGYGEGAMARAVAVAERHASVWAAVGIHPHDARFWSDPVAAELRALVASPRVVALGEIGLDFHYDSSPRDQQRVALRAQLRVALELAMPIVIHDRSSAGETLQILIEERAFDGRGVLYHCYSGDLAELRAIVEAGGWISIPGIVTFKKAAVMQQVARQVPAERLLIETDSPYLTPAPFRGRRNEPARVVHTAAKVAELRGMTLDELARLTWDNASRYYGIDPSS